MSGPILALKQTHAGQKLLQSLGCNTCEGGVARQRRVRIHVQLIDGLRKSSETYDRNFPIYSLFKMK
jgi:hypothetical protein